MKVQAATLDLAQFRFPLSGQLGAFQAPVLEQSYRARAHVRRQQCLLLSRDVAPLQQVLEDGGTGRGRAQPLLIEISRQHVRTLNVKKIFWRSPVGARNQKTSDAVSQVVQIGSDFAKLARP